MKKKDLFLHLCTHPLFSVLTEDEQSVLREHTFFTEFADGEAIQPSAKIDNALCVLLKGQAAVCSSFSGKGEAGTFLRTMRSGAVFGVQSIYALRIPQTPASRITATKDCEIAVVGARTFEDLLERNRAFNRAYIRFLTGRTRYLNEKIGYLTAGTAEQKLSRYFLLTADENAAAESDKAGGIPDDSSPVEIELSCTMQELASLLDLGRASLYRAFDSLQADGLLKRRGNCFCLTDPKGLSDRYL